MEQPDLREVHGLNWSFSPFSKPWHGFHKIFWWLNPIRWFLFGLQGTENQGQGIVRHYFHDAREAALFWSLHSYAKGSKTAYARYKSEHQIALDRLEYEQTKVSEQKQSIDSGRYGRDDKFEALNNVVAFYATCSRTELRRDKGQMARNTFDENRRILNPKTSWDEYKNQKLGSD